MNNYVILKFGTLKGYNFTDEFAEKNKTIVENFKNIWNKIYSDCCSTMGGSEKVQKNKEIGLEMIDIFEKLYNLGVIFENGWDDTYYNSFKDIKDYMLEWLED